MFVNFKTNVKSLCFIDTKLGIPYKKQYSHIYSLKHSDTSIGQYAINVQHLSVFEEKTIALDADVIYN